MTVPFYCSLQCLKCYVSYIFSLSLSLHLPAFIPLHLSAFLLSFPLCLPPSLLPSPSQLPSPSLLPFPCPIPYPHLLLSVTPSPFPTLSLPPSLTSLYLSPSIPLVHTSLSSHHQLSWSQELPPWVHSCLFTDPAMGGHFSPYTVPYQQLNQHHCHMESPLTQLARASSSYAAAGSGVLPTPPQFSPFYSPMKYYNYCLEQSHRDSHPVANRGITVVTRSFC